MDRRLGWFGESNRHALAARGVRTGRRGTANSLSSMYDLRGLESAVREAVEHGQVKEVDLRFQEHYMVADGSRLGDKPLKVKDEVSVPTFDVVIGGDMGWVILTRYGSSTFYNNTGLPDRYWMEPTGYKGLAKVLPEPVRLEAPLRSGGTVPFDIHGVIGLEDLVGTAGSNGHGRNGLVRTVNLGV